MTIIKSAYFEDTYIPPRKLLRAEIEKPIPLILYCPACRYQHVDDDTFPDVHRSHLCRACLTIWRPADVPTIGVQAITTRGKKDTWPSPST